jgi:hypothetical protein
VRYVPFVWVIPVVLFQALPARRDYLLLVPLALFAMNTAGVFGVFLSNYREWNQAVQAELEPHRNETVLLDRSTFQFDGIFGRYDIRQKFANPEAGRLSDFWKGLWTAPHLGRQTGRMPFGSSIAFEEDLPPLPASIVLADAEARPWLRMSDGVALLEPEVLEKFYTDMETIDRTLRADSFPSSGAESADWGIFERVSLPEMRKIAPMYPPVREAAASLGRGVWNYESKVKLYMRVEDEPKGDMELSLTASPRALNGTIAAQEMEVFVNNRSLGKWLWEGPDEKTLVVPLEIGRESFGDEMRLLTLTFIVTLPGEPESGLRHSLNFEKLEFRPAEPREGPA